MAAASTSGAGSQAPRDVPTGRRPALARWAAFRHPAVLPVLFFWCAIGLGITDYVRAYSLTTPGLLSSNDWLINYEGGFVRRGLAGQLLYGFHHLFGALSLANDLLVLQVGLYVALGVVVTVLAVTTRNRLVPWVLLSPGAVLFSSYSILGGFRKELLLFLALGVVALASRAHRERSRRAGCIAGAALYLVFLLSWEGGIVFLPVVMLSLQVAMRPLPRRWFRRTLFVLASLSVVAFAAEALNTGNREVVLQICSSLQRAGIPYRVDCTASGMGVDGIGWLQQSWHTTAHQVAANWPGYGFYLVWLALGLAPFLVSGWVSRHRAFTLWSLAAIAPLLVIGSDYGRWVHIAIMCVTLQWFMTVEHDEPDVAPRGALATLGLVAWATCWSVPFWRDPFLVGGFWNALDLSGVLHAFSQILP